jgi:hypothetical protein
MTAYKQTLGLIHQSNVQLIVNRLLTLITPLNRRRKKKNPILQGHEKN